MILRACAVAMLLCALLLRPATGAFDTTPMIGGSYDWNWAVMPPCLAGRGLGASVCRALLS